MFGQGKMHTPGGIEDNKEIVASLRSIPPFNDKNVDTFFFLRDWLMRRASLLHAMHLRFNASLRGECSGLSLL